MHPGRKDDRAVTQQTADGVDWTKRSWSLNRVHVDVQAQSSSQGINYERIFINGFRHQTHLRITMSRVTAITKERQPGFLKTGHIRNGRVPTRSSGFMEIVRPCPIPPPNAT